MTKSPLKSPVRAPIMVTAQALSREEAMRVFDLNARPARSARPASAKEVAQAFKRLAYKIDRKLRNLGIKPPCR